MNSEDRDDFITWFNLGRARERELQKRYQWRRLFSTVVYASFIGYVLAFLAFFLLVTFISFVRA